MIKNIFLPAIYKNKRLYNQKVLSLYSNDDKIYCGVINLTPSSNIVENVYSRKIEKNSIEDIRRELEKYRYDLIMVAIPSSKIIFNEIDVPFVDNEKIKLILDYQIEDKLPFNASDAISNFIVIKKDNKNKKSKLLTATIRNSDLSEIIEFYKKLGVNPDTITIDLFSIYSLYEKIPQYENIKGSTIIVDFGQKTTRIALIEENKFRTTRMIYKGYSHIILRISKESNKDENEIKKDIEKLNFNLDNSKYHQIIKNAFIEFFQEIQFTLNSFVIKLRLESSINKIFFTGNLYNLKKLPEFCESILQIPSDWFKANNIFKNKDFIDKTSKNKSINWNDFIINLGTIVPEKNINNFNLRIKNFRKKENSLINKQIQTAIGLSIVGIVILGMYGYMSIHKINKQIKILENKEINKIIKVLPREARINKKQGYFAAIKKAKRFINEKIASWGEIGESKLNILKILMELSTLLNVKEFNVTIQHLNITEDKATNLPKIELEGIFKSNTGEEHFKEFSRLEHRFNTSKILKFWDSEKIKTTLQKDEGIMFNTTLTLKD